MKKVMIAITLVLLTSLAWAEHPRNVPPVFVECDKLDLQVIRDAHRHAEKTKIEIPQKDGTVEVSWNISEKTRIRLAREYTKLTEAHDCWQKVSVNLFRILDKLYKEKQL